MRRALYLLWRVPLRHALWLALPLPILAVSVAFDGHAAYSRLAAHAGHAMPPFDVDQLRYFTAVELKRQISRLFADPFPEDDGLETIELEIGRGALAELNLDLPHSGKADSKNATLWVGGDQLGVKARYTGDNHWHWMYPQKSWRIKAPAGSPVRDRASFSLKNPPTGLVVDEVVACELAAEIGLIAPEVRPVKLLVNGVYHGVYLWWDVVDESLLRRQRRMPGSIYSGDGAPREDGLSRLWRDQRYWTKEASRSADREADRSDIALLIDAVNSDDPLAFRAFAERYLDLERFARFIALDRALGGAHHDFHHNHKLYFDPYRSRFEPIEWDFSVWHLEHPVTGFDTALNPLLIALRRHPAYEHRFQEVLFAELRSTLRPEVIGEKLGRWVEAILPALAADGDRDARSWLETDNLRVPVCHSETFTMAKFRQRVEDARRQYGERHARLLAALEDARLEVAVARGGESVLVVDVVSGGWVAQTIERLAVSGSDGTAKLWRDADLDGRLGSGDEVVAEARITAGTATFAVAERVHPGLGEVPRAEPGSTVLFGLHDLVASPLAYRYFVTADGALDGEVEIGAVNAVTGAALAVGRRAEPPPAAPFSCHPWRWPAPPSPQAIALGPGEVAVPQTREFGPEVRVEIAPGTTLRLGPGASLWFRGPVRAEGTPEAPIVFEALEADEPWGVVALHGRGTAGSVLRHCRFAGGSVAEDGLLRYSGMVSVMATADIRFEDCRIGSNHAGDDALHWGDVTRGSILRCAFAGARGDAVDLDVCEQVVVEACSFEDGGADLLDLMTSRVAVRGCVFRGSGGKGISAGEGSTLDLADARFERCTVGIEVKDGSLVRVGGGVALRDCGIGVNLCRENLGYGTGGTIEGDRLEYAGAGRSVVSDPRSSARLREVALIGARAER